MRSGDVMRIGRHSSAADFTVDLCSARFGMFIFFKHDRSAAFSQYKSIAVFVVGSRCGFRRVVSLGKRSQCIKSSDTCFTDSGFGPTRHDDIGLAQTQVSERVVQGVGGRRARRNGHIVRTAKTILYRDMAGAQVGNHFRNEERIEAGCAVAFGVRLDFFLKREQASDAGAPYHANPVKVYFLEG